MFKLTRISDSRIDLEISGKIDADEMTAGLDRLLALSEGFVGGSMLYRIHDFDLPSLGAIAVELGRLPQMFGLIRRFDKIAVVCDQAWIRKGVEIEGALIPKLEIKGFTFDQADAAEVWLG